MTRQRGQIVVGVAVAGLVLVAALAISVKWGFSQAEKRAEAEASLAQWKQTALDCSDSVETAQKAALEAQGRAKAALAKVREASVASESERARLKAEMGKKATCEGAVKSVREGLKK